MKLTLLRTSLALPLLAASGSAQCFEQELEPAGPQGSDGLGSAVALHGEVALVARPGLNRTVTAFERVGGVWQEGFTFVGPDHGDGFGWALELEEVPTGGGPVLVAAIGDVWGDGGAFNRGDVTTFELQPNGSWLATGVVADPGGGEGDFFGASISISAGRMAIGVPNGDGSVAGAGLVELYERQAGGAWLHVATLEGSSPVQGDGFGGSVSLDGDRLLVGADQTGSSGWGVVHVFELQGPTWVEVAMLSDSPVTAGRGFGSSVALFGDIALVGEPEDSNAATSAGAAHVFQRDGSGTWSSIAVLEGTVPSETFGTSVALEAGLGLVGAPGNDVLTGAAFLVAPQGSTWEIDRRMFAPNRTCGDFFGLAVGLSGGIALVGAPKAGDPEPNAGEAYVFVPGSCDSGVSFCAGDGSGTSCPCNNGGAPGRGCANGAFVGGCELAGIGAASVMGDALVLSVQYAAKGQPGLFFQGENAVNGGAGVQFGDGLRCAGGNVVRLETVVTDVLCGLGATSVSIATKGAVQPGETRRYQFWYRDPSGSPCGASFNLSNGLEVTWQP